MPVLKCPNGKYRIGGGKCMYVSKAKALRAYAAYRAISHTEAFLEYIQFVVKKARELLDVTTTADVAKRIAIRIKVIKKKKKELPCPGSKIRSKGKGRGVGIGKGKGPIGRMK